MKVLCTGDLHIGRRPTRLPSHVDCRPLSCAAIWSSIVDYAITQQVDVVALSGDVVDRANRYFEAIGPLERGLRRLADAGITTVAVAGNHDYDVLPDLANALPNDAFRLLGRGGQWERVRIERADGSRLDVDGWSFPTEHVRDNPVDSYRLTPEGDVPVLGLLHADLDVRGSAYAPVALSDLRARSVTCWLLGHVHAPSLYTAPGTPPVLYPGSPQPMDPGEPGVHGVWLVDFQPGTSPRPLRIPLATVRYESLDVDVTGVGEHDDLRSFTHERLTSVAAGSAQESDQLRYLSLRVRITGRTALHRDVGAMLTGLQEDWEGEVGEVTAFVERLEVATQASRDVAALARGSDAVAVLARLLDTSDETARTNARASLIVDAERMSQAVRHAKPYQVLASAQKKVDLPVLSDVIDVEASRLLDALLAQREDA